MKHIHRPGDVVACACEGCSNEFTVKPHGTHARYCSKRCRDMAARIVAGSKPDTGQPKQLSGALGNIGKVGEPFSGTVSLGRRPVVDLASIPQDRPEFWT